MKLPVMFGIVGDFTGYHSITSIE